MNIGHTRVAKGKRVRVFMRNGEHIDGVFSERTKRGVILADGTIIPKTALRCVSVLKPQQSERNQRDESEAQ